MAAIKFNKEELRWLTLLKAQYGHIHQTHSPSAERGQEKSSATKQVMTGWDKSHGFSDT